MQNCPENEPAMGGEGEDVGGGGGHSAPRFHTAQFSLFHSPQKDAFCLSEIVRMGPRRDMNTDEFRPRNSPNRDMLVSKCIPVS